MFQTLNDPIRSRGNSNNIVLRSPERILGLSRLLPKVKVVSHPESQRVNLNKVGKLTVSVYLSLHLCKPDQKKKIEIRI